MAKKIITDSKKAEIMYDYLFSGMKRQEIANKHGIPANTLDSMAERGKWKLLKTDRVIQTTALLGLSSQRIEMFTEMMDKAYAMYMDETEPMNMKALASIVKEMSDMISKWALVDAGGK